MPKTATRAADTTQAKPVKKKPRNSVTIEIDLGDQGKELLDKMSEHRQVRLAAEKEEKILKEQLGKLIDATLGKKTQKPHQKLLVRAGGVLRGTRSWRGRKNTDFDILLQAFPEAYEAAVSESEYTQFDPA
jgi:hypothetical protein